MSIQIFSVQAVWILPALNILNKTKRMSTILIFLFGTSFDNRDCLYYVPCQEMLHIVRSLSPAHNASMLP